MQAIPGVPIIPLPTILSMATFFIAAIPVISLVWGLTLGPIIVPGAFVFRVFFITIGILLSTAGIIV